MPRCAAGMLLRWLHRRALWALALVLTVAVATVVLTGRTRYSVVRSQELEKENAALRELLANKNRELAHKDAQLAWKMPLEAAQQYDQQGSSADNAGETPLIVLATTVAPTKDKFKQQVLENVLNSYLHQKPTTAVHPLVFTDSQQLGAQIRGKMAGVNRTNGMDTVITDFAQEHGWPVLASMMKKAEAVAISVGAPFYGFSNGDIMFTPDLAITLQLAADAIEQTYFESNVSTRKLEKCEPVCPSHSLLLKRPKKLQRGFFMMGRRTNVAFADFVNHLSHHDTCDLSKDLLLMAKDGEPMEPFACDYFIFAPGSFDWDTFPRYVVGNLAYDNAVVALAVKAGLVTVDASDTIHAFHQTGVDGNSAGHGEAASGRSRNDSKHHNYELFFAMDFGQACVLTSCAGFRTTWAKVDKFVRVPAIQEMATFGVPRFAAHGLYSVPRPGSSKFLSARQSTVRLDHHYPTVDHALDFSFVMYMAQVCSMIHMGGYWKEQVASSGQIQQGSSSRMWNELGCSDVFPSFDIAAANNLRTICSMEDGVSRTTVSDDNLNSVSRIVLFANHTRGCAQKCANLKWCKNWSWKYRTQECLLHHDECKAAASIATDRTSGCCSRANTDIVEKHLVDYEFPGHKWSCKHLVDSQGALNVDHVVDVAKKLSRRFGSVALQMFDLSILEMAKHWICNVQGMGHVLAQTLFIAIDAESYRAISSFYSDLNVVLFPYDTRDGQHKDDASFYMALVNEMLQSAVTVWLIDVGSVWLRDPTELVLATKGDWVTMNSARTGEERTLCERFQLLRPTRATIQAWSYVSNRLREGSSKQKNHRASYTGLTHLAIANFGVQLTWLPPAHFASEQWYTKEAQVILFSRYGTGEVSNNTAAKTSGFWALDQHGHCKVMMRVDEIFKPSKKVVKPSKKVEPGRNAVFGQSLRPREVWIHGGQHGTTKSASLCEKACQEHPDCNVWTWHDATLNGYAMQCWMRSDRKCCGPLEDGHTSGYIF
eukprot:COSAG01_NODE_3581_length_5911_cov_688.858052_3_plen_994_part_00